MSPFKPVMTMLSVWLIAATAVAQTTNGSMTGSVVDAQNQVVPGADVTITNEQTGNSAAP